MNDSFIGFPDEYAHPKVKAKDAWGLQVAKSIWSFTEGSNPYGWKQRVERFIANRNIAIGLQGSQQYKPSVSGDPKGQAEFMHMFWKETSPLPKYIRAVTKILTERKFEPKATSLDITSRTEKDSMYARLVANMLLKHKEQTMFRGTGIKLVPDGEPVPKSAEEVEILKETTFKSSVELTEELGVKCVFNNNNVERLKKQLAHSLTVTQWGALKCYYDAYGDIKVKFIRPERLIVPYSEDDYFTNRKWTANVERMTISEIRMYNNQDGKQIFSDEELLEIASRFEGKNGNPAWNNTFDCYNHNERWNSFVVDVVEYEYNTVNKYSWVAKKGKKGLAIGKANPHSKPKESNKKELIQRDRQVWYDGMWIVGTDKMLRHKLRDNMVFSNGEGLYDGTPRSQYVVVAPEIENMRNKAIPESAEVYVHQMHLATLKMQQMLSELAPPATAIDVDALSGVLEGLGMKDGNPMDIYKLKKQVNIWFYKGKNENNENNSQNPIYDMPSRYIGIMNEIVTSYNHNLQALENELGINDVMVGATQNQYEGLGARQMKYSAGVKSLSHLQDALDFAFDEICNTVSIMVQDTIARGDKIKGFENAIGKTNVELKRIMKDFRLAEIGVKLEMMPTEEDIQYLERDIELCLKQDTIRLEDAQMVRQIYRSNVKLAQRYMTMKRKQYEEDRMREAQNAAQANAQQQMQSTQVAAEMERQNKMVDHEMQKEITELKALLQEKENTEKHFDNMELKRLEGEQKLRQIAKANENSLDVTTSGNPQMGQPRVYTGASGRT